MAALGSETDLSLGKISENCSERTMGGPQRAESLRVPLRWFHLKDAPSREGAVVEILALVRQTMVLAAGKTSTAPNSRFSHDTVVRSSIIMHESRQYRMRVRNLPSLASFQRQGR